MASALAKQDVRIAQDTATTALDNNFAPSVLARAPLVVASAIGSLVSLTCEEEPLLLEKVKKMFGSVPNISEEMIGGMVVPQGVYDWLSRSDLLLGTTSSPEVLRPSGVSGEGIRGMMVPPSVYEWLIKSDPLPGMESAPELLRIPKIFVTPIEERGVSVLTTPIETEAFPQILSTPLPERAKPQILSTPDLGETGLTVFTHQSYNPPPKTLPGFPDAVWGKRKTPVSSGGGLRKRWQDKQYIYEWDSQHGSIEKYKKSTGGHLGEFDYKTGIQTKPADQSRRIEK